MMQVFYFYLNDMRRMKVTQLDGVLMLSEQHLRVHTAAIEGHVLSQWVDMARWAGIADEVESKPQHVVETSQQNRLYSVPQRKTEDLLRTAVRALGCIYRFTHDNYARDALREIEAAGWKVDWEGGTKVHCHRCNDVGCEQCS